MENYASHDEASTKSKENSSRGYSEESDNIRRWNDWPEALARVRELQTWSQFINADHKSLGTLQTLLNFFAWQPEPYPSIEKYVKYVNNLYAG